MSTTVCARLSLGVEAARKLHTRLGALPRQQHLYSAPAVQGVSLCGKPRGHFGTHGGRRSPRSFWIRIATTASASARAFPPGRSSRPFTPCTRQWSITHVAARHAIASGLLRLGQDRRDAHGPTIAHARGCGPNRCRQRQSSSHGCARPAGVGCTTRVGGYIGNCQAGCTGHANLCTFRASQRLARTRSRFVRSHKCHYR